MVKPIIRRARWALRSLFGRDYFPIPDSKQKKAYFGSDYGGWDVAVEYLNADSIVYSFGVGEDASFDLALIETYGLTLHAFDPTPRSLDWVRRQQMPSNFVLHAYGIADVDGDVSFTPPENPEWVSYTILDRPTRGDRTISVPVKKLSTIMSELGHTTIDLLKMDVEGAEYAVIQDICRTAIRPRQLLVEFHHRFPDVAVPETREAVASLRDMGYSLFSVSDTGEEYSFLHQGRS